jgi:hypothetical protein
MAPTLFRPPATPICVSAPLWTVGRTAHPLGKPEAQLAAAVVLDEPAELPDEPPEEVEPDFSADDVDAPEDFSVVEDVSLDVPFVELRESVR